MTNKSWLIAVLALFAACGGDAAAPDAAQTEAADGAKPGDGAATTVKPEGPVRVDYRIIGTPVVGQPVGVDLEITSNVGLQPVAIDYRINDPTAMQFPEAQPARVALAPTAEGKPGLQQVRVIPLREGRLYLNVSAEVETESGTIATAIAIPIEVGAAPVRRPEAHGVTETDENGEAVRVLEGT